MDHKSFHPDSIASIASSAMSHVVKAHALVSSSKVSNQNTPLSAGLEVSLSNPISRPSPSSWTHAG